MLLPVDGAGEPLTPGEPRESGLPCFDLEPSTETEGSTPQPLGELVEPCRETRRPVDDYVG
jgi:hypothetical protein